MRCYRVCILLMLILSLLFTFSACGEKLIGNDDGMPNAKPIENGYKVDDIEKLEEWVRNGKKDVLPNNPNRTVSDYEHSLYGDLSYLLSEIEEKGYLRLRNEQGEYLHIDECIMYDQENVHDLFVDYVCQSNIGTMAFPCYIIYIPEEEISRAKESPIEYMIEKRNIELYSADSPLTVGDYKIYREVVAIDIGGETIQAIAQEYVDSDLAGKVGTVFFIYDNMLIQLQRPYSNEMVMEALREMNIVTEYIE